MVAAYTLYTLSEEDRQVFKKALDPTLTDRIPLAADFAVIYAIGGFGGAVAAMLLAILLAQLDRSLAIPTLWTALPLLVVLGLYLGHRRWLKLRVKEKYRLSEFTQALQCGQAFSHIYTITDALVEKLSNSHQINVLALTQEGETLWLPSDLCPHQGKQLAWAAEKIQLIRSNQGTLLAAWPSDQALSSAHLVEGLAVAVENQIKGAYDSGEVYGIIFKKLKETFLKKRKPLP